MSGLIDWLGLPVRTPKALAFRAEPMWIGDAAAARRLLAGRFRFAGREVQARELGPWRVSPPTPAFAEELHAFAWLDDLAAAGARQARGVARSWLFGWIAQYGEGAGPGWAPETAGRRALHWAERADLVLHDADADLERRFLRALAQHARRLRRQADSVPAGLPRLRATSGLLLAVMATEPGERPRRAAARRLAEAAETAIDAEGGLVSRNPEALCESLILLASTARHLEAAGLEPETAHARAVARAQSALRALRMRDGALPRFHGGGPGAPGRLDHALSLAHPRRGAPPRERAMGYVRLAAGRASAVVDAAPPPPTPGAHASTLSFEFACGAGRLIANCGPGARLADWADACRATAAQSALSLEGVSSARISPSAKGRGPHPFVQAPRDVPSETAHDGEGNWFLGAHDGYLDSHGLIHRRRLFLSLDGRDFRGEDVLEAPDSRARARFDRALRARQGDARAGLPFALHFHLHPRAEATADGDAVALTLEGLTWRFTCLGGAPELHDSVWFEPDRPEPRATKQIVVTARAVEYAGRVSWGLRRADPA
ncbi:MAG: heparinase II/III family protein [Pseudomonadota bacterium]